jgi:hypothetical protein
MVIKCTGDMSTGIYLGLGNQGRCHCMGTLLGKYSQDQHRWKDGERKLYPAQSSGEMTL